MKLDVLNATGDYLPVLTLTFTNHQKASADDLQWLGYSDKAKAAFVADSESSLIESQVQECWQNKEELQFRLILANALDMADNDSRYIPCVFSLSMPKASNDGNISLSISIQNNSQAIMSLGDYYAKSRYPVFVTLDQWDRPAEKGKNLGELLRSLTLYVESVEVGKDDTAFSCSFGDLINSKYPAIMYTAQIAPGLKYANQL